MEQPKENTNPQATEDSIDTARRGEELFLMFIHGVMTRIEKRAALARVNRKVITAPRRVYKKHGRIFEPGASTPPLPAEIIEAIMRHPLTIGE